MNQSELDQALIPVRDHFRGTHINVNTVLAAYLRAAGVVPNGTPWAVAKSALEAGRSFRQAAEQAAAHAGAVATPPRGTGPKRNRNDQGGIPTPSKGAPPVPNQDLKRPNSVPISPWSGGRLDWFPKKFGPGDIDGQGAIRLLGQPNIPPVSVLVREMAQNSWDARIDDQPVDFAINLRRLTGAEVQVARSVIFTGEATKLGLQESLGQEDVWALEVSDRGAKGLGGPIRNDLTIQPGMPTNFIDLVFNIGAPRDVHLGGGTYGFGKTISYLVSRCGTVLIWSKSKESGILEDRLIGSGIGHGFDCEGHRFTGRHWWGISASAEQRVEPVTGSKAGELGGSIFARGFNDEETGTSILIIDPELGGVSRPDDAARLAEAVTWHLWPKLLGDQSGRTRMIIDIQLEGVSIPLPRIEEHPVLQGHAEALTAVRAEQEGKAFVSRFATTVQEVWCLRPEKLLGHIAFTRFPQVKGAWEASELSPIAYGSHHITLMRHQAELVVKYDRRAPLEVDGVQWAAVFKPVEAVDDSFAAAEPPAHDDWVVQSIRDKKAKRDVRVGLTRINECVSEFLGPTARDGEADSGAQSTAGLADALADLVGLLEGPRPTRDTSAGGAGGGARKPSVEIVDSRLGPARVDDRRYASVQFSVVHPIGKKVIVSPVLAIGVEGGSDDAAGIVKALGWSIDEPSLEHPCLVTSDEFEMDGGGSAWLVVDVPTDLALDVRMIARAV